MQPYPIPTIYSTEHYEMLSTLSLDNSIWTLLNIYVFVCNFTIIKLYIYLNTTGCYLPYPWTILPEQYRIFSFFMQPYPISTIYLPEHYWMLSTLSLDKST